MSGNRASRGVFLPTIGQWLVIAAALCGGWLLWSELREPHGADAPERPANPVANLNSIETFIQRGVEGVPELIAALSDRNPKARRYAVYGLGRIGRDAVEAAEPVRERLADESPEVRAAAVNAFWLISPNRDETSQALAPLLADPDQSVSEEAVKMLSRLRAGAAKPVMDVLSSRSPSACSQALRVLRRIRQRQALADIDDAVRKLRDSSEPRIRVAALIALADWGLAGPGEIRELLRTGDHLDFTITDPDGRGPVEAALQAIAASEAPAPELLPDILALLDDSAQIEAIPAAVRKLDAIPARLELVLEAMRAMKTAARPAAPRLFALFNARGDFARVLIAQTLFDVGAETGELLAALLPLLFDANHRVAGRAGRLLILVSPEEAARQVSILIQQIEEGPERIDKLHAFALFALAPQAAPAIPVLVRLLGSHDTELSSRAAATLGELGPSARSAVPGLVSQLGRPAVDFAYRTTIVEALGKVGPAAQPAVPALLAIVGSPEPNMIMTTFFAEQPQARFREAAISALQTIGDDSQEVIAKVRSQATSQSADVRVAALETLVVLAKSSPVVLAELVRLIRDESPNVRAHAALAIGRMLLDRREAVAPLVAALTDGNPYVRTAAAISLGHLGAQAKSAVPALRLAEHGTDSSFPNARSRPAGTGPASGLLFVTIPELDPISVEQI